MPCAKAADTVSEITSSAAMKIFSAAPTPVQLNVFAPSLSVLAVLTIKQVTHRAAPSLIRFAETLAFVSVHLPLALAGICLRLATFRAAIGEARLIWLQLKFLSAHATSFDRKSHFRYMIRQSPRRNKYDGNTMHATIKIRAQARRQKNLILAFHRRSLRSRQSLRRLSRSRRRTRRRRGRSQSHRSPANLNRPLLGVHHEPRPIASNRPVRA
jgi:hypothetical protein